MISRLGRKRRDRRAQTQPDHPFTVDSCEYLTDGAFALLRVSGSGSVAPVALITQGDGPESFDPLPQPDAGAHGGLWQLAFALPTEVIEPGARVWLHDGGLYLADVVVPAAAGPDPAVVRPPAPAPAAVEEPEAAPVELEGRDEAARLREKLADREEELARALKDLLEARTAPDELRGEVARLEQELAAARAETAAAEQQRVKLEEANKSRRAGIARRKEDRDARRQVAELEARVSEREKRIEELEAEAHTLATRHEQVAPIEDDSRQRAATDEDLRALLDSEREIAAAARREIEELKQELARVGAEYAAKAAESGLAATRPAAKASPSHSGVQSPPWSALDDELLARIEKAKALTR